MSLPSKENFSEWFHEIIQNAEIMDVRYPVKGLYVWFPFGFKLRQLVYSKLREIMDREHHEVYFPALIPETELGKESEHIRGFEDEVYWITHGGLSPLEVKLALRPTSETAMYPMFKVWIRTHSDLPLRVYQIVNTFRYETKHTRPLIRLREITSFKEAHTAHRNYEEAEEQVRKAIGYYKEFYDFLAIPYMVIRRPDWDKFPGAVYTIAFDTIMPDGRSLQIGTVHHLGENFARTFEIKYEALDGNHYFVHQTCYGISERCIASLISIHGDDLGLVLPFEVAPIQIVVIPILYKGKEERVLEFAKELIEKLKGFRVVFDTGEDRPGAKYYKWELKGVPLRFEIGPKEAERREVIVSFRDERKKFSIPIEEIDEKKIKLWGDEMRDRLRKKAVEAILAKIKFVKEISELSENVKNFVVIMHLCKSKNCGEEIENFGGKLLGWLEEIPDFIDHSAEGKCIVCGDKGFLAVSARSY
ncbi:MAG: proline--tRNA ligase [Archaeoglobaceae archaeon]|nr:proline--tRNA ligase [Archaeoglobaceae archaeon]MDW8128708.1 proline--tRNA ligase [Archaeoglobaceae archaeon]